MVLNLPKLHVCGTQALSRYVSVIPLREYNSLCRPACPCFVPRPAVSSFAGLHSNIFSLPRFLVTYKRQGGGRICLYAFVTAAAVTHAAGEVEYLNLDDTMSENHCLIAKDIHSASIAVSAELRRTYIIKMSCRLGIS